MKKRAEKRFRFLSRNWILVFTLFLVFSFYMVYLDNFENHHSDDSDWYEFTSIHRFERDALLEYGELPLWNPFVGGGYPFFAYPFALFFSPFFIFILLFGEVYGSKILTMLFMMIGASGMYYLLSYLYKKSRLAPLFGTLVFSFSSYMVFQINSANFKMYHFMLLPLAFLYFLKSFDDIKYVFFSAVFLTLIFLSGEVVFLFSMMFVVLYSLCRFLYYDSKKFNIYALKILLIVVMLTVVLSSVKLIPYFELISISDGCYGNFSSVDDTCENSYLNLQNNLLSFEELLESFLRTDLREHHTNYVGIIPVVLFLLSLLFINSRNYPFYLIFLILALGLVKNPIVDEVYRLLFQLPIISSIVKLNKYIPFLMLFCISLGFPSIISKIEMNMSKRYVKYAFWLILILLTMNIASQYSSGQHNLSNLFGENIVGDNKVAQFYNEESIELESRDSIEIVKHQYQNIIRGVGTSSWYGTILLKESVEPKYFIDSNFVEIENPNYKGEFYLLSGEGSVVQEYFGLNRHVYRIDTDTSDYLVVNQNYNKNWQSSCGEIFEFNGIISVKDIGDCDVVELKFVPYSLFLGIILSILSFLGGIYVLFFNKQGFQCFRRYFAND